MANPPSERPPSSASEVASSEPGGDLSPSVREIIRKLSGRPVTADAVLNLLFELHPEYGGERAGSLQLAASGDGSERPVEEWIEVARSRLESAYAGPLHGRLLVACLAIEESAIGRELAGAEGFLSALENEIEEALEDVLTEPSYRAWSALSPADRGVSESVPTHPDAPAYVDELNQRPFARVVARRMQEVWNGRGTERSWGPHARAFMIHLHGRWGSGKTSILNFMREELTSGELGERWVVVDFNGWRYQRFDPPWWMLIEQVYRQALRQLSEESRTDAWRLRLQWLAWRFRADWLPALVAVLGVGGAAGLGLFLVTSALEGVNLVVSIVLTVLSAAAGLFAGSRALVFGSARAARTYEELSRDPLDPVVRLYERLIDRIDRPVAIFIDDLDRCEGPYVVDLIEGIQTLLREAPVTYVVAADRSWIRAGFEEAYDPFEGLIGEPGRPLGYLFLEKVFQFSVAIPRLADEVRDRFWGRLLTDRVPGSVDAPEERPEELRDRAREMLADATSQDRLREVIAAHEDDPALGQALRAEAAERITSADVREETEHQLQPFARYLEPNPRSMKRLVNAYGVHQAVDFLEGRDTAFEPLVLWTILSLRWPVLADLLADLPELVDCIVEQKEPEREVFDPDVAALFVSEAVREVVRGSAPEGEVVLDATAIGSIVRYGEEYGTDGAR